MRPGGEIIVLTLERAIMRGVLLGLCSAHQPWLTLCQCFAIDSGYEVMLYRFQRRADPLPCNDAHTTQPAGRRRCSRTAHSAGERSCARRVMGADRSGGDGAGQHVGGSPDIKE